MELDFSYFGFRPTPKKKIGTTFTNDDNSKLSLKKKNNLKAGTSSKHDCARTVKELMPNSDKTVKDTSGAGNCDSSQSNASTETETNQERENNNPRRPAESRHATVCDTSQNDECLYKMTSCESLRQIRCVIPTSGSNSSSSNDAGENDLPSNSSPTTLPSKHGVQKHNRSYHDITTIIISDSSSCSNSEGGSVSTPSDRRKPMTQERNHSIEGENSVSSLASLFDALPNTNNNCEYISSSVVVSTSYQNKLLASEHHSTSVTSSCSSQVMRMTNKPSRFNTDSAENAAISVIPNIILETSDSESEHDSSTQNVMEKTKTFPRLSRHLLDGIEEDCETDGFSARLQTPPIKSKFQDIQKWLDGSTPSDPETDKSLICNSNDSSLTCITNIPKAEEANSKNILSLSAENVLNQLYGPTWKKSSITVTKKCQTEGRKTSRILSCSDIDDSFDEFLKKINRKHNKLTSKKVSDAVESTDFINDDSISNESLGFYQAVLNTETNAISRIPPGSSKGAGSSKQLHNAKHLGIGSSNNRKLSFSDEEENVENEPSINSITNKAYQQKPEGEEDNFTSNKRKGLGEFQPGQANVRVNKKAERTKIQKSVQLRVHNIRSSQTRSFLESLSASTPESCCHPEAHYFKSNFKKRKEELCSKLFKMFNSKIFGSALPEDLKIEWNVRLQRTAGLCFNGRVRVESGEKIRTSRIELSIKVIDSPDRLRDTLIHELCHAATWIINAVQGGHGRFWKVWSVKAMKGYPELPPIKTCHEYKIQTKFTYKCSVCGYCVNRHSKSLNIETKRCGYCHGKFELFVNYKNKASAQQVETATTPRNPNGFALFVKENYGSLKTTRKDLKHGEVMKLLGQQFAAAKIS